MESQLVTTNLFLGIIAAISVVQTLLVIGAIIAMFAAYRRSQRAYLRVIDLIAMAEERHVVPTMVRVNAILDDVKDVTAAMKDVTATVQEETERLDNAIRDTINRVDHTAERVRSSVLARTSRIVGFVRGARTVIETILNSRAA